MKIRLGTRGSSLALLQAGMVTDALKQAHPDIDVERVIITTSGDWKPVDGETRLCELAGGKGLFAHEIEKSLLAGEIDIGVHSLKDMPSFLPEGLALDHVLPRADVRDAFICHTHKNINDLPHGAVVGTSSLRRQAVLLSRRPDLTVVPFRGNIDTRLQKVADGQVAATFLAMAGLTRMNITGDMIHPLHVDDMLPACGQGIVGIETRAGDARVRSLLNAIHHAPSGFCAKAERAVLAELNGSCHTPIGAYAEINGHHMYIRAMVAEQNGKAIFEKDARVTVVHDNDATSAGTALGQALKAVLPPDILL